MYQSQLMQQQSMKHQSYCRKPTNLVVDFVNKPIKVEIQQQMNTQYGEKNFGDIKSMRIQDDEEANYFPEVRNHSTKTKTRIPKMYQSIKI